VRYPVGQVCELAPRRLKALRRSRFRAWLLQKFGGVSRVRAVLRRGRSRSPPRWFLALCLENVFCALREYSQVNCSQMAVLPFQPAGAGSAECSLIEITACVFGVSGTISGGGKWWYSITPWFALAWKCFFARRWAWEKKGWCYSSVRVFYFGIHDVLFHCYLALVTPVGH